MKVFYNFNESLGHVRASLAAGAARQSYVSLLF